MWLGPEVKQPTQRCDPRGVTSASIRSGLLTGRVVREAAFMKYLQPDGRVIEIPVRARERTAHARRTRPLSRAP